MGRCVFLAARLQCDQFESGFQSQAVVTAPAVRSAVTVDVEKYATVVIYIPV